MLNSYPFGFNGQERETEVSPGGYSAEFWMYESRLGRRWNRDPKPNPSISDYATFANNPIWFSDPDGDTVMAPLSPSDPKNKFIISAAQKQIDEPNTIHLFAHGSNKGVEIYNPTTGKTEFLATPQEFDNYMTLQKVTEWDAAKKGEQITVILHSCRTAKTTTDEKGNTIAPFAQDLSKAYSNITVVAPDERDWFNASGELGPYKATNTDENGARMHRGAISRRLLGDYKYNRTNDEGIWRVFKKGTEIQKHNAKWKPTSKPTFIDSPLPQNKSTESKSLPKG